MPTPTPTPTATPDDGATPPSKDNPTLSIATPGAAKPGVPNFFIDKFAIPPFLLPIYQAAGTEYGIRWEVLAAINEIETNYGRNLNVSSAGAEGWMQFMPDTWKTWGVDANQDGYADPLNPVDAIFTAARYLKAAGADTDLRKAVYAYNHADWYVDSVLLRAQVIGGLPTNLVTSLTGLTEGRFPVAAQATYADEVTTKSLRKKARTTAAVPVSSSANRRGISIFADAGVAGRRGQRFAGDQDRRLQAPGQLHPGPGRLREHVHVRAAGEDLQALRGAQAAEARRERHPQAARAALRRQADRSGVGDRGAGAQEDGYDGDHRGRGRGRGAGRSQRWPVKTRLFAHPDRANSAAAGGAQQQFLATGRIDGALTPAQALGLPRDQIVIKHLKVGSQIPAGTVLGRVGAISSATHPHLRFEVRPAGKGAPRIDPKPILDGWKLLESTAIYRAKGESLLSVDTTTPTVGQILLMDKNTLMTRVLNDPRISIYDCGRQDIRAGAIDRRVLATLEFLVASGFNPTVSALECGHSYLTTSGNVSEHSTGTAVDIAAINGIPILGHQGKGSITDLVIQRLLTLQGDDEAAPDHLADDLPGHGQHALAARPQRPHPRRLPPALRLQSARPRRSSRRS